MGCDTSLTGAKVDVGSGVGVLANAFTLGATSADGDGVLIFDSVGVAVVSSDGAVPGVSDARIPLTTKNTVTNNMITPASMIVLSREGVRSRLVRFASDMIPPGRWSVIEELNVAKRLNYNISYFVRNVYLRRRSR